MAASDMTSVAFIYKRRYSDEQVAEQTLRDHVWMELMGRRKVFAGEDFRYVVRSGNGQGVSGTFADAQAGASSSKGKQFAATPGLKYGVITLDGPAMARSRAKEDAFLDLVTMETDGILEEVGDSVAFDGYGDGSGRRGRIASIAGQVLTLTDANDARNFKEGMTIIGDNAIDGSSPNAGSTTVVAIDEDGGKVTVAAGGVAAANLIANDYLFRKGDPGTCSQGLESFFPLTAPTAGDSFRGVDRSSNVRAYAGVRVDDTASPIEENIGLTAVKINTGGKKANCSLLNPMNFWTVAKRLNAKVEFQAAGGTADYGFQYIQVHTPAGVVKVYSDPDARMNRGYVGNKDRPHVRYLEETLVHIIRDDGKPSMRQTSADGLELRARVMHNNFFPVPGEWGVFNI